MGRLFVLIILLMLMAAGFATRFSSRQRLGHDSRRVFLLLGHLSGIFILSEYLFALRGDVHAHLARYERFYPQA